MGAHFIRAVRAAAMLLWGMLATFALSGAANAGYTFTSSTGNFYVAGNTDIGSHCDDCAVTISLPFPVEFYGVSYTSVSLASNGILEFTTSVSPFANSPLSSGTVPGPSMFPYWDDLRTDNLGFTGCSIYTGGVCGIFTLTEGVAPDRVFDIEWRATYFADTTGTANFEIRLYENQTYFDFLYGPLSLGSDSATVGVQNDPIAHFTDFTQYSFDTAGTLSNGLGLRWDVSEGSGVPEPATLALLGIGFAGLAASRRRKTN